MCTRAHMRCLRKCPRSVMGMVTFYYYRIHGPAKADGGAGRARCVYALSMHVKLKVKEGEERNTTHFLRRVILYLQLHAGALACDEHTANNSACAHTLPPSPTMRHSAAGQLCSSSSSSVLSSSGYRWSTSTGHWPVTSQFWFFHVTPAQALTSYRIRASLLPKSIDGGEKGGRGMW